MAVSEVKGRKTSSDMLYKSWKSADNIVKKDVISAIEFSKKPTERATVHLLVENIQLNEKVVNGLKTKFNSDILDGTSEKMFVIGESCCEIDRQIERAVEMMFVNEKSLITILMPCEVIEQQDTITFIATLRKLEIAKFIWDWTPQEKYEIALKYKEMGVSLYKEGRNIDAFHKFSRACKIIITLEPIPDLELDKKLEENLNSLRLILYNNMAGCHLNRKNYEHTISMCNKVLDKDESNVKALYRRGMAHGSLKDVENAAADFKKLLTLEPHNSVAKDQFVIYNAKVNEANQKCKDMVKRMFKT